MEFDGNIGEIKAGTSQMWQNAETIMIKQRNFT